MVTELDKIKDMFDLGALSQEEFQATKAKILA